MTGFLPALLLAVLLSASTDGGSATAYERFPEYESVQEVPVVGSLASHTPRLGPPPRSAVRLAAH